MKFMKEDLTHLRKIKKQIIYSIYSQVNHAKLVPKM